MAPARVQAWPVPAGAWQAQLRSLVIGMNTPYAFTGVDGLDLPPILDGDMERAETDGSFGGIETTAGRDLIFDMLIHPDMFTGASKAVLSQALKAAFAESSDDLGLTLNHPDLGPLLFVGRPRRVSYKVDRQFGFKSQEGILALFRALDPLIYSATLNDITIPFGTAGTNAGVIGMSTATLLGVPSTMKRIIQNGGFVSAAPTDGGWLTTVGTDIAAGATLTRDTGTVHSSGASGKLVTDGLAVNEGVRQVTLTNLLPNTSYTFTCWINLTTAGGNIYIVARDVTNGNSVASGPVTALGVWTQLSVTLVTGATGPVQVQLSIRDSGTAVARTFYVTEVRGDLTASTQAWAAPLMGVTAGAIGGGGGAAGFYQVISPGTATTRPVTRIKALAGPVTGPLFLDRVESGETIMLNYNMVTGDVLELDHDLHSVLLNGGTNRADVIDASTSWWAIAPGVNTIHYRTGGPGAGSQAELLYRDAYW